LRSFVQCVSTPTFSTILQTEERITVLGNTEIVADFFAHQGIVDEGNSWESADSIAFSPATFEHAIRWETGG
jgi:hypothetical protein